MLYEESINTRVPGGVLYVYHKLVVSRVGKSNDTYSYSNHDGTRVTMSVWRRNINECSRWLLVMITIIVRMMKYFPGNMWSKSSRKVSISDLWLTKRVETAKVLE